MSTYIVCHKKRNNPRIDIRICMKKCDLKDDCKEFQNCQKTIIQNETQSLSIVEQSHQVAA